MPGVIRLLAMVITKEHMSIEEMKSLARQTCEWPEIDDDIRTTVKNYEACLHMMKYRPEGWNP